MNIAAKNITPDITKGPLPASTKVYKPGKIHPHGVVALIQFAKSKHRVTNWPEYNESLRRRGDVTIWIDESVAHDWGVARTGKRGRPGTYSDLAITVSLEIRTVFHLALRQTQGFLRSVFRLMKLELGVPDFTTLSRRAGGLEPLPRARTEAPVSLDLVLSSRRW